MGNIDPFSGAAVMSRGIVGDRGGRATVQSPIKKQAFALDDGVCLDDPDVVAAGLRDAGHREGDVEVGADFARATKCPIRSMFRASRLSRD